MQVCESTEIVYDKNVVNFSANDRQCARRLQEVCTRLSLIYFALVSLRAGFWWGCVNGVYESGERRSPTARHLRRWGNAEAGGSRSHWKKLNFKNFCLWAPGKAEGREITKFKCRGAGLGAAIGARDNLAAFLAGDHRLPSA